MTRLCDGVDGFVGNLIDVFIDPTPGDVMDKYSSSTSDYTETHRLGSECQGSIHYHFIDNSMFLVDGDIDADVRCHLRSGRSGIDDAPCARERRWSVTETTALPTGWYSTVCLIPFFIDCFAVWRFTETVPSA